MQWEFGEGERAKALLEQHYHVLIIIQEHIIIHELHNSLSFSTKYYHLTVIAKTENIFCKNISKNRTFGSTI